MRRPIIPRGLAVRDVEDAIDHLLVEASATAAFGFIDALKQAYAHGAGHPASGSTRYAHELGLPNVVPGALMDTATSSSTLNSPIKSTSGGFFTLSETFLSG